MEFTKALMVIAVVAVVIAAVNVISIVSVGQTGFASTEIGNATLEIEGKASINFTNNLINWSTGSVDVEGGYENATLISNGTNIGHVGWLTVSTGLVLENDGNTDVTLNLSSDNSATAGADNGFPGDDPDTTDELFQWQLNQIAEAGSCTGTGLQDTTWTNVAYPDSKEVCDDFNWDNANDEIEIDLLVRIPKGTPVGAKVNVITATAVANP